MTKGETKVRSTLVRLLPTSIYSRLENSPGLLKILNNIGWLFLDKVLRMGVGLFVSVWVARYLGPEEFGHLNYAIAFVGLFAALAVLGLDGIVVRNIVRNPDQTSETLGTSFVLRLVSGLAAVVLAILIIFLLRPDDDYTRFLVSILSVTLIFKSTEVVKYWFESQVQSRYIVWVENGVFLTFAVAKVALILSNASLTAFVWITLFEAILVAIGFMVVFSKTGESLAKWKFKFEIAKSLLRDGWPLVLSSMAIMIYMRIDQVMLGEMLGQEAVGIYSAAARLSEIWYFIPMSIVSSVFPAILQTKKVNQTLYLERMQRLYNFLTFISVMTAIFCTLLADQIVLLLYGVEFAGAGTVLSIQIWAGVFVSMGVARGKWLLAENLQHVGYWYIGLAMIVNIVGNYILIPLYGTTGAAVATVISQVTASIIAPALFKSTRISSWMLVKSLNPLVWMLLINDVRKFNGRSL